MGHILHEQLDQPVVDQDAFAGGHVPGQVFILHRNDGLGVLRALSTHPLNGARRQHDTLALLDEHTALGHIAHAQLGPLQVGEDGNRDAHFLRRRTDACNVLRVEIVVAM